MQQKKKTLNTLKKLWELIKLTIVFSLLQFVCHFDFFFKTSYLNVKFILNYSYSFTLFYTYFKRNNPNILLLLPLLCNDKF